MHDDPLDLVGNAKQSKKDQQKEAAEKQQRINDFKWLMGSPSGRRIVGNLLAITGQNRSSFTTNRSLTDFNEGQRNVGLYYIDLINEHCIDEYVLMIKERQQNGN